MFQVSQEDKVIKLPISFLGATIFLEVLIKANRI